VVWPFVHFYDQIFQGLREKISQLEQKNTALFNQVWDLVAKGDTNGLSQFVKGHKNLLFLCNYEQDEFKGFSLLHLATLKNQGPMVKWLLQQGVSPMSCNAKGETPLQIARKNQSNEIIKILEGKVFSSTFNMKEILIFLPLDFLSNKSTSLSGKSKNSTVG